MAVAKSEFPSELKHGSGASMSLDRTRLLLAFKEKREPAEVAASIKPFGLILEDEADKRENNGKSRLPEQEPVNHTHFRFWARTNDGRPLESENIQNIRKGLKSLDWIGPVYRLGGSDRRGLLCPVPNVLMIRPANPDLSANGTGTTLSRYGMAEVTEKSRYLNGLRYYELTQVEKYSAYDLQTLLVKNLKDKIVDVKFENMPLLRPVATQPNDTLYIDQWNMEKIKAGGAGLTGWDISTGAATTVICVLDQGCDLTHPDLQNQFSDPGINLGTMMPDGSPTGPHGTACAGIVAAQFNNAEGVSGVAGGCRILPLALQNWTDAEVAAGINYAADNGAKVISMSFGQYPASEGFIFNPPWDFTVIDPAIAHAHDDRDVVLCAASGNEDLSTHNRYPGRHPLVIACGASDEVDNRKNPASPDGENWWGSNYGIDTYLGQTTAVSVVAPGVHIPTTDQQGTDGYNMSMGAGGNYTLTFNGTSSATPHVAGLAGVIRSLYPTLTNDQVRVLIERTAEKVGAVAYADVAGFPSGPRNQEMGYGRINMYRALEFADVLIKDYPSDPGAEPSTPPGGDFWDFSDAVVRITDDNVFDPGNPSRSSNVERGQTNYIYVQVTNNGPHDASNVAVTCRLTPFVGLQFDYPGDWTDTDATHVAPTPVTNTFASIPAGATAMAKFTVSAAQVEDLWGWINSHPWHPCMLVSVTSDNDFAFTDALFTADPLSQLKNNLAQRNLSVIDVLASASVAWPVLAGHKNNADRFMEIVVDRAELPKTMRLLLELDYDGSAFPLVDFNTFGKGGSENDRHATVFLQRTRMEVTIGSCRSILTVEKGSKLCCIGEARLGNAEVQGGEVILRNGKRYVDIRDNLTVIRVEKQPNGIYPLALHATIPADAKSGQRYFVRASQRNAKGITVGGAGAVYIVR